MSALALDNFDRANNADLGTAWTPITSESSWSISGNTAVPVSGGMGADRSERYSGVTWPADQYAQGRFTVAGTSSGTGPGPAVRASSSIREYYRLIVNHGATNNITLAKRVAAVYTQLWQRTQAFTDGDTFRLEIQGTTLRVLYKGVQIGADATDAAIATGSAGLCYSSTGTTAIADDWEGGDFTPRHAVTIVQSVNRAATY